MGKILFVATVDEHIRHFHLPYIQWFSEQGWQVDVASHGSERFPFCRKKFDLPYQRTPLSADNLRANRILRELCERYEYDIVHFHTPVAAVFGRLAIRKSNTKVLYTAHGFHFFKGAPLKNWLLFYPAERLAAHFTDGLITMNAEDFARAQKFRLRRGGKVYFVHGVGVDLNKFAGAQKADLGLDADSFAVLSVGELNVGKNHISALHAIAETRDKDTCCVIAGRGELADELTRAAYELGVTLRLLGYRTDMPNLYAAADMFLFPSKREGLPTSLTEAMASGLPCVASDIRGSHDLISDGVNGLLCGADDVDAYAAAILRIKSDSEFAGRLGAAAKASVQAYSRENVLAEMAEIYGRYMV